jgi:hypothetical protein
VQPEEHRQASLKCLEGASIVGAAGAVAEAHRGLAQPASSSRASIRRSGWGPEVPSSNLGAPTDKRAGNPALSSLAESRDPGLCLDDPGHLSLSEAVQRYGFPTVPVTSKVQPCKPAVPSPRGSIGGDVHVPWNLAPELISSCAVVPILL